MISHRSPISGIAAHGNEYVLTAGYDNQVILWDQPTKKPIARATHDHLANQCSFSPGGRWALTSSSDHTARLWSVPDLKLHAVFAGHNDDVEMSVFHPTLELIATASRDHNVRVWDYSGALVATFTGHDADVISVGWATDGDTIISSSDDGTIKQWSLAAGQMTQNIDLGGVETDTIAIATDGTIFAGNDSGEIIIIRDGSRSTVPAHDAGIKRLVLDGGRNLLVSLSYDRTMRLWDVSGAAPVPAGRTDLPSDVWPRSCAFAGSHQTVFATFGATYRVYDHHDDVWETGPVPPTGGVNAVIRHGNSELTVGDAGTVQRDGAVVAETGSLCNFLTALDTMVLTGGQLGRIFDALTGEELHRHRSPLNCGSRFLRNGEEHALIGTYTGEGLIFRVNAGGRLEFVTELRLHSNAVKGVAAGAGMLFSVSADAGASWFGAHDLQRLREIPDAHDRIANGCAALGETGRFASVSRDLRLRLWGPDGTAAVVPTPHTHSIKCVAASADGGLVATGSYNGRVIVHDTANGTWTVDERPTTSGISSLAWDPVDDQFLASSYDGHVYPITR